MAIQNRRGSYSDFAGGANLQDGEFGIVMSGDTNTTDGTGVYIAPVAGTVHRLLTDDDKTELDGDIAAINGLFTSGTWTPTVSRAAVSSSSGAWRKIGDIVFLSCIISFDVTQASSASLYIDGASLPSFVQNTNCAIGGSGASPTRSFSAATQNNRNVWLAEEGVGRFSAPDVAGITIWFELTAIPR